VKVVEILKKSSTYSTSQIAGIFGVHVNTVRLYEQWGFISKADRNKSNYRIFTDRHIIEFEFARMAIPGPYPVRTEIVRNAVREFAKGNYKDAMEFSKLYHELSKTELLRAEEAFEILEKWILNKYGHRDNVVFKTRKEIIKSLDVTVDALRTWERNGLFEIRRNESNILVFSEYDVEKIKIIRLLRNCGYSIASLLNVFSNDTDTQKHGVSELLSRYDEFSEFSYVTDRFIPYLKSHIDKSRTMIEFVEKMTEKKN